MNDTYQKCKANYKLTSDLQILFDFNIERVSGSCVEVELFGGGSLFYINTDDLLSLLSLPVGDMPSYSLLELMLKRWKLLRYKNSQIIDIKSDTVINSIDMYSAELVFPLGTLSVFGFLHDIIFLQELCEDLCVEKEYRNINLARVKFDAYEYFGFSHISEYDFSRIEKGDSILIRNFFVKTKVKLL